MRLTDQQRADRRLSEAEFRAQVDELAAMYGWESMHVDPLRGKGGIWRTPTHGSLGKGWPDTVYVHPTRRRVLFVEFKRELGQLSPDQHRVLAILRALEVPMPEAPEIDFRQRSYVDGVVEGRERGWREGIRGEVYVWRPSDFPVIAEVLAR